MSDYKTQAKPQIVNSATDYYPFGMAIPGRQVISNNGYRYGFNGKEHEDGLASGGYDFGARIYDSRIARWLAVDPLFKKYTPISPYCFALNTPLYFTDGDGRAVTGTDGEPVTYEYKTDPDGKTTLVINGNPDEHTQQVFNALLKTPTGQDAIKRVIDIPQQVSIGITTEKLKDERAETQWFNAKGKDITGVQGAKLEDPLNTIKITLSVSEEYGDLFDKQSVEMKLNHIGVHEILGHITAKGGSNDPNHDDLMYDKKSIYESSCLQAHNKAIVQYVALDDKMNMSEALSGLIMMSYQGKLTSNRIDNYKADVANMIREVIKDPVKAQEKIDTFNKAADEKFADVRKK